MRWVDKTMMGFGRIRIAQYQSTLARVVGALAAWRQDDGYVGGAGWTPKDGWEVQMHPRWRMDGYSSRTPFATGEGVLAPEEAVKKGIKPGASPT